MFRLSDLIMAVITASAITIAAFVVIGQMVNTDPLGSTDYSPISSVDRSTSVEVASATSTRVAAFNAARQYLEIGNVSGGKNIYCAWGVPATLNSGLVLFASTTRIYASEVNVTAALNCISNSSTSTVVVTEK